MTELQIMAIPDRVFDPQAAQLEIAKLRLMIANILGACQSAIHFHKNSNLNTDHQFDNAIDALQTSVDRAMEEFAS